MTVLRNRYRRTFRIAAGTSAAPYGYTLAICIIGAVLTHGRGISTPSMP